MRKELLRPVIRFASAGLLLFALAGCGGESSTSSSQPNATPLPAPTATPVGAWAIRCSANVKVDQGDVFDNVIGKAQKQCPEMTIHDAYESMYMIQRSVNEIYADENLKLNDYINVP